MKIWRKLRSAMNECPNQIIEEGNVRITYREMISYAEMYAKKIKGQTCCAIYCESELKTAMMLLSCFAAGVTAVPLSSRYGKIHCEKILRFISPPCIITDVGGNISFYNIDDSVYENKLQKTALIMCTSGTTGQPKGIMLSEKNIISNVEDIEKYFFINKRDTILISRPLYHCAVLTGELIISLLKGAHIVFLSEKFSPISLLEEIKAKNVTVLCGTPTILYSLARFNKKTYVSNIKHVVVSGECLNATQGEKIRDYFSCANIYHVYGLTEASPRVSYLPPEQFSLSYDCVGIPLDSVEIQIRDSNLMPVKDNKVGVLWIKGPNIMQGYYNNPSLTAKTIVDGWLCTGDLAVKKDGLLCIVGRNDDLIIRAGMNIYPSEIEAVLQKDVRVKSVKAFAINREFTEIGIEICGDFESAEQVKSMCIDMLPTYQMPNKIYISKEFAITGSGKLIRGVSDYDRV